MLLLALLCMPFWCGVLHAQKWTQVLSPSDQNNYGAFFTDSVTGVITNWRFDAGGSGAEIYRTPNGGAGWQQSFNFGGALTAVAFADKNNGTAVGGDPGCICGGIYRTTDGGASWTPQEVVSGATPSLYAVYYVDANTGFLGGDNGVMLKTTNGGTTWTPLNTGTEGVFRNIHFVDVNNGFAVVATPGNSLQGEKLFKTTNGGTSWKPITFTNFVPMAVWFISPSVGFVGGNGGRPVILKTTDGGETWTEKFHDLGSSSFVLSMQFVNKYVGYAVGGNPNFGQGNAGVILSTTDGGEHWTAEESNYPKALRWVHFPTETVGYAVGEEGTILKTTRKAFVPPMPTITLSRTALNFGSIEVGENKMLSFDITPANTAGLRVDAVKVTGAAASSYTVTTSKPLPAELAQGGKLTVNVSFTPAAAGAQNADLSIITNDAASSPKKVTLTGSGTAAAQPSAVASIDTLAFGEVNVGTTHDMALQISPANKAGLVVDSVYLEGTGAAAFSLSTAPTVPVSLDEGEAMTITVTYAPASEADASALVAVRTNDASVTTLKVPVTGKGKIVAAVPGERNVVEMDAAIEPTPANTEAMLRVMLRTSGRLRMEIYNDQGRRVMTMQERMMEAGEHTIPIKTRELAAGTYTCRIGLGAGWITRRFVVLH